MKKFLVIPMMGLFLASCGQKEKVVKDYVVVHGNVSEGIANADQIRLFSPEAQLNVMAKIDAEGNFRDTLRLTEPASFNVFYDNSNFSLFLENGMDLEVNFKGNNIVESLTITGEGEKENNSVLRRQKATSEFFKGGFENVLKLNSTDFNAKLDSYIALLQKDLTDNKEAYSPKFIEAETKKIEEIQKGLVYEYDKQVKISQNLAKGMPSPEFNNYVDYAGGTKSLKDFRGKYVYIDVWATWCGPCMYEIPFMTKLEGKFKNSNIAFVSISIDKKEDEDKWRKMIVDKDMAHGVQLLADKEFESSFIQEYFIDGIPRFILLDPQGNIINHDASRPSEEQTVELLKSLGL